MRLRWYALLRIIGEDKTLSIKLGAEVGNADTEDIIQVRGISADVNRAVKEIEKIVEDAKNDEIVGSYVCRSCLDRHCSSPNISNCTSLPSSRLARSSLPALLVLKVLA
jgi:hypothetical protein